MKSQVVLDECRNEEIAVVVAALQAQVQRDARSRARILEQIGPELALEKWVARSLINQDCRSCPAAIFDQRGCVVVPPAVALVAKVACQRLLAPGAPHRRGDRGERRYRSVAMRIPERYGERAVAAHRMSEEAHPVRIDGEMRFDIRAELRRDIRIHPVARGPRRLGRVDVEPGSESEIVAVAFTGDAEPARAGVGNDDRQSELGRDALRSRLDDEVFLGARKPGKPIQHRYPALGRLRRKKQAKAHGASRFFRGMRIDRLHAAEAEALADRLVRRFGHASSNAHRPGSPARSKGQAWAPRMMRPGMLSDCGRAARSARRLHALNCTPFAFAACVAIRSMIGGDRQSYGSSPISFSRLLTAPMFAGLAPDSMIDETNAANSGGDQPRSGDSSVWMKSSPYKGWSLFSIRPYMCTPQPVHA